MTRNRCFLAITATMLATGCGSQTAKPTSAAGTRTPTGKMTEAAVGTSATDDGLQFSVSPITSPSSYSDPAGDVTPRSGAELLVTQVKVTNGTAAPTGVLCNILLGNDALGLVNASGQVFTPMGISHDLTSNQNPDGDLCAVSLQPGLSDELTLLFEVPSGTQVAGVVTWNPDGDGSPDDGGTYIVFRPVEQR